MPFSSTLLESQLPSQPMPQKADHPALFLPGVHRITEQIMFEFAVSAFPLDTKRSQLFGQFGQWSRRLRNLGVTGTLWIDGSFLTSKFEPGDIDLVLWNPEATQPLNSAGRQEVFDLFDHAAIKLLYGLDLYVEYPPAEELIHREAYWKGFFGFCHDRVTAKGFVEVSL